MSPTPGWGALFVYLNIGPPFVKIGRSVLYRWADIHAYLDANTHEPAGS